MSARAWRERIPPAPEPVTIRRRLTAALPDLLLFACLLIALVGAVIQAWKVALVGVVVLLVVLLSRLWARLALERVECRRSFSIERAFPGDSLSVDIVLENRKPLPLPWVKLSFLLPDGLVTVADRGSGGRDGGLGYLETFSLGRYERVRARRTVEARRRGAFRLGSAQLESGDLFGLYSSRSESRFSGRELIVYPPLHPLPGFALPTRIPSGETRSRTARDEDPSRPNGVREYRPGDPMRNVDWKTTARHQSPYVRTFDPGDGHHVVVLLECATSELLWRFRPERLEAAVSAAASVAAFGIRAGHRVGLVTNGLPLGSGRPVLAAAAGDHQLAALMDTLARVQPMPTWPLETLLGDGGSARGGILPRRATLVYVTAMVRDATTGALARASERGSAVTCVYVGLEPPRDLPGIQLYDYRDRFDHRAGEAPAGPSRPEGVIYA